MSENVKNFKNVGVARFTMNMDIACLDHGEGSFVCINDRLIISSVRSFEQIFALLDELEEVDSTYNSVFEIPAFMQWHDFKIAARNLEQLPIGTHMTFDNIKVVKVSEHLVSGIESDTSMLEFSHAGLKTLCSESQTELVEELLINNWFRTFKAPRILQRGASFFYYTIFLFCCYIYWFNYYIIYWTW